MPGWFSNQVAVITGASSGIGWSLAKVLAAEGAKVGLLARRKDKLEELAAEIRKQGTVAALAPADVGSREQTLAAIQQLRAELGPVDLLVANAGIGMPTELDPMNIAEIEAMVRVNLFGAIYSMEAVLPEMLKRGRGHLAAVSSLAAYKGLPGESAYCASKAALNSYMEGLRIQLAEHSINVTVLCPGFVRTPMVEPFHFDMPWLLEADDAARRMARAIYRKRKVFNFPWQLAWLMKLSRWAPDGIIRLAMKRKEENPQQPAGCTS